MTESAPAMRRLDFVRRPPEEMIARARAICEELRARRSVRDFSSEEVPREALRRCVEAAAQAPSGADRQPWTFVLVTDPALKRRIREAAEREERDFYARRALRRWRQDLAPLGTGPEKAFLETAPALIVVFAHARGRGVAERNYYVAESVGIAVGFLLAALHHAGVAALTYTPSRMGFLAEILARPAEERPFVVIPVGYPAPGCVVPDIRRKPLSEVLVES